MALEPGLETLYLRIRGLHGCLAEVRTTIREDHPTAGESVLVDVFGDAVDDLIGWVAEAEDSVLRAQQALSQPASIDLLRQGLFVCHQKTNMVAQRYTGDLVQYERIAALLRLGRERGGEWRPWAASVKQGLERCHEPLVGLGNALLDCWLDLTERSAEMTSFLELGSPRPQGG